MIAIKVQEQQVDIKSLQGLSKSPRNLILFATNIWVTIFEEQRSYCQHYFVSQTWVVVIGVVGLTFLHRIDVFRISHK